MSWDVVLFNFAGKPPTPVSEMSDGWKPPLLGTADEVRGLISTQLPEVDWSDPEWGILDGEGFSIEFNLGDEEEVTDVMLHVRGGGDPIASILKLCAAAGWSALDCSTDQYLDPADPSRNGWSGFQKYRDKVASTAAAPTHCPKCKRAVAKNTGRCMYCG